MVKALVLNDNVKMTLWDVPLQETLGSNDVRVATRIVGV